MGGYLGIDLLSSSIFACILCSDILSITLFLLVVVVVVVVVDVLGL